jgi:hypothetical protein
MMVEQSLLPSRRSLFKWFLLILSAKFLWLILFTVLRNPLWNPEFQVGSIGLYGGDSQTYYYPVEQFIATGEYYGMCRMPGVMPVYYPLRLFLSVTHAQQAIVILQVVFDSLATLLLAIMALRIFKSRRAFQITILLSCATAFIALRNVYLLSDSLCISSLITAFYFLCVYLESSLKRHLIYAGLFLTWSIFLRQITLLAIPVMGIMLLAHHTKNFRQLAIALFSVFAPLAILLGAWTLRNRITYGRTIILVAPLEECMYNLTPELAAIRTLIIGMGEDFQPWSKGGGAYWFFNQPLNDATPGPFEENQFTTHMQADELLTLRADYRAISDTSLSLQTRDALRQSVIERAQTFHREYIDEHTFSYHVGNKVRFARLFLFPGRIDDIPFPSMDKMNLVQKGIKAWSLVSLWLIHALAILVGLIWLFKKEWSLFLWFALPMSFIAALSYLGYIEQRYLATSYPFFILILAGAIGKWQQRRKVSVQPH